LRYWFPLLLLSQLCFCLRAVAMNLDPVLLTEFQAWRILGGLFLTVYAFGHLPGLLEIFLITPQDMLP
jgi:hypothetical protein